MREHLIKFAKLLLSPLFILGFRMTMEGTIKKSERRVILTNRYSFLDSLLAAIFLPTQLTFILRPQPERAFRAKVLSWCAEVIFLDLPLDSSKDKVLDAIASGQTCVFFLEEYKESFNELALILSESKAELVPFRIQRLGSKISLHVVENLSPPSASLVSGRDLFLLYSEITFANYNKSNSLFSAMLRGAQRAAKFTVYIEDSNRAPLSSRQFVTRCFILGRQLRTETQSGELVGLMLPTTIIGLVSFFALQAYRRTPAMLNFSSGFYNLYSACQTAGIKTIYSSRQFIQTAKLETLVSELVAAGLELRFLEDIAPRIKLKAKIAGLIKGFFPKSTYWFLGGKVRSEQCAVVLFTSGSEGVPKGVALTHENILSNCYQMISRVDFSPHDIFFNALPIFHCFGLTAGSLTSLFTGNRCFLYPSPLHYKIIPGLVRETKATIFFATDTFLTGYARTAKSEDFSSLSYVFAGAEKVKTETVEYWQKNFAVHIYEGYGATEASPVISLNCPTAERLGSVGLPLPALEYHIEPVEGISEGGRLYIRGPNVISGYLGKQNSQSGWHDTGDIVKVDQDGFLFIKGRAKRFAKLGGEMISLAAVESIASTLWPEQLHAALSRQCPHKGEQIILFSENSSADKKTFIHYAKAHGQSELLVPQIIFPSVQIPVLASGKIDYPGLERDLASFFPDSSTRETNFL
ncbi:Bifunctional protein aas [Legionella massiliensis]|uniref:Bifunctional protein aas n=1 Tax=Legionella massiliensis TaxID=1034943 RepID=A0A078KYY4_9GAMM|nr:AMP-binding protein [Legionella massiliensis]CDZ76908.1 Bifunctional protein aas [Legionella massiliensis]CEE12646.1 Bifunctional protein Aas [Legionella massiliensis]